MGSIWTSAFSPVYDEYGRERPWWQTGLFRLFVFFVLPLILSFHIYVLWHNHYKVRVYLPWNKRNISYKVNTVMLGMLFYGVFVATVLYSLFTWFLRRRIKKLQQQLDEANKDKTRLQAKLKKYMEASHQIQVPYPLDNLVEKDLLNFSQYAYRAGVLEAKGRK
ncbi:hypothetical protein AAMO2058_001190000 [Amorphochlora amoebiformis]